MDGREFRISDFELYITFGTRTFGRVLLGKVKDASAIGIPVAVKILKKSELIRLKQVDHV